jgi:hypothetical protein
VCLFGQNFAKFQPEKYDLNLYKGFTQGKNGPNLPDFEGKKNAICQIWMISSSKLFTTVIENPPLFSDLFFQQVLW